jgi:hypothetical protein
LDLHAAQRQGDDAMAGFLRTGVGRKMRRLVGMSVRMAIEASGAAAWLLGAAVLGFVVLLLRNVVTRRRKPSSCFGGRMPLNSSE